MPIVRMPNGALVNMPDNPTEEQLTQLKSLAEPSLLQKAWSGVKSGAADIARGAMGAADPVINSGMQGKGIFGRVLPVLAAGADMASSAITGSQPGKIVATLATPQAEKVLPTPQDDPAWRQYVRRGLEGAGGQAMLPVPGGGASQFASAAAGGASGELAARLFGEGPAQRFLGGLAGGVGTSMALNKLSAPRIQESRIAREAMEGVTPEQLAAATALQKRAAAMGVKLDLAQALTGSGASPNNLNTIRDLIANTKEGNKTQALLHNQPTEVNEATRIKLDQLVPGRDFGLEQAGLNAQEAATKAVNNAKAARSAAVRPDYEAAGNLPADVRLQFANAISEAMTSPGATPQAVEAMQKALQSLKSAPSTQAAMEHALDYDTLISTLSGQFKGTPLSPADPKSAGQIKALAAQLNGILKGASPQLAAAEAKFAQISQDIVNPLKQGPVGQVAGRGGYLADSAAASQRIFSILDAGSSPSSPVSPVRALGKELGKADPEAFQDAVKSWLASKVDKYAASDLARGQAQPENLAKGIYEELFRSPKRFTGLRDAVTVIAEQNGVDPKEVARGLENLGTVVKAASNRPGSIRGMSPEQLQAMAGHSMSANALRVFGFLPFERVARWREGAQAAQTFRTFDELLTSPEGAATLAKLAKTPPMSPAFAATLQGFESGMLQSGTGRRELQRLQDGYGATVNPQ